MSLSDDLELIAEHIGDDQPNLPAGSKNTLLMAAKALSKLPHTADGVPVVPGMDKVYFGFSAIRLDVVWHAGLNAWAGVGDGGLCPYVANCHSTPELSRKSWSLEEAPQAAEKASKV